MVGGCVNIDCLFRPASNRVYPGLISGPYSSGSHLVLCRVFPGLWDICFDGFGFARDFVRCCVEVRTGGSFFRKGEPAFRCFDFLCTVTHPGFGVIVIFGRWGECDGGAVGGTGLLSATALVEGIVRDGLEGSVFVSSECGACCSCDFNNVAISCGDSDWNPSCSSIRYVVWYTICVWMSRRSFWMFGGRVVSSFLYGHKPIKSDCSLDGSSGFWWLLSQSARVERSWEIFFGVFGRMLVMSVSRC